MRAKASEAPAIFPRSTGNRKHNRSAGNDFTKILQTAGKILQTAGKILHTSITASHLYWSSRSILLRIYKHNLAGASKLVPNQSSRSIRELTPQSWIASVDKGDRTESPNWLYITESPNRLDRDREVLVDNEWEQVNYCIATYCIVLCAEAQAEEDRMVGAAVLVVFSKLELWGGWCGSCQNNTFYWDPM